METTKMNNDNNNNNVMENLINDTRIEKTIKDLDVYDTFKATFDIEISFDENGKKIKGQTKHPSNWQNIKTRTCKRSSNNSGILTGKLNDIIVYDIDVPKK